MMHDLRVIKSKLEVAMIEEAMLAGVPCILIDPKGDLANIAHLSGRDFVLIRHDVTNFINLPGPLDYVFHFASPASPIDYLRLPLHTLKVGSIGTHRALGLAKAKNARFLTASTSS